MAADGMSNREIGQRPRRADRRRGKSDPIDAYLAALQVLRMSEIIRPLAFRAADTAIRRLWRRMPAAA